MLLNRFAIMHYNQLYNYKFLNYFYKFSDNLYLVNLINLNGFFVYNLLNIFVSSFVKTFFVDTLIAFHEEVILLIMLF